MVKDLDPKPGSLPISCETRGKTLSSLRLSVLSVKNSPHALPIPQGCKEQ